MTTTELSQCEKILAALPTAVFAIDAAGKVIVWNAAMEACTGVAASEMIGKRAWTAFSVKKMQTPADLALSSAEEETDEEFSVTNKATGLKRQYRIVARPMLDGEDAKGAVATLLDLGESTITSEIRSATETLASLARGEVPEKIAVPWNGEGELVRTRLNECIEAMSTLTEVDAVLRRMAQNDYSKTVSVLGSGLFASLAEAANLVQTRIRLVIQVSNAVASGDLSSLEMLKKLGSGTGRRSENDELAPSYIRMMEAMNGLIGEVNRVADEHTKGDIDVTLSVEKFQGVYRATAESVNAMVASHISAMKKAMICVGEFAKGNFEAPLEQFPGKKAIINDSIELMRIHLKELIQDAAQLSRAAVEGRLKTRADANKHDGDFRKIIEGVNATLDAVIGPLNMAANYVDRISKGDIPPKITDSYNGDFNEIKNNLNTCIDAVNRMIADAAQLSKAAVEGHLTIRADAAKHHGDFRKIIEGVNATLDAVIGPLNVAAMYVDRISKGDIPAKITDSYNGDLNEIKSSLNTCIEAVNRMIDDTNQLVRAAVEGRLNTRADATKHQGDFRKIVEGVNATLDAVLQPVTEATEVLERLAQRNLTVRVMGDYKGDHAKIKEAINSSVSALQESLVQVSEAVDQVAAASGQIASSSQSVAQGASEQASSLEQVSSSLEEMSGMTKQNADNTQHAKTLAQQTKSAADKGSEAMAKMVDAMGKIRVAAEGTAEIIRDINEISFQTNLLALNAAVEAARAGDAGRGFAVVAEEVRNLALRSKDAAKKTEDLIKQSVQLSDNGQVISKEVNGNLVDIVESVGKVTGIIGEITAASQEQARGIDHVTSAMSQMDKVTQQNAANSEESSSAAEELSSQSQQLAAMIGTFTLGQGSRSTSKGNAKAAAAAKRGPQPAKAPKPSANGTNGKSHSNGFAHPVRPEEVIPLETDPDFKQF